MTRETKEVLLTADHFLQPQCRSRIPWGPTGLIVLASYHRPPLSFITSCECGNVSRGKLRGQVFVGGNSDISSNGLFTKHLGAHVDSNAQQ